MVNNKILLVAAGRRYSFVERLIDAGFFIYSYETSLEVPIAELISGRIFVKQDDDERTEIYDLCKTHDIPFVLPFGDSAAVVCSTLDNCIGHNTKVANICHDKKEFDKYMKANFPQYYPGINGVNIPSPAIIKPRFGNSSKGIRYHEGGGYVVLDDNIDVAQYLVRGTEYSVDAYFDKYSNWAAACPRTRDRVAGGEVVDSQTLNMYSILSNDLISITKHIGRSLGMTGPACFQYVYDECSSNHQYPQLFEINARFGGGCILSLEAGMDIIRYIKDEYYRKTDLFGVQKDILYVGGSFKSGLKMKRVFKETFFV